jgi:hypothetical protein
MSSLHLNCAAISRRSFLRTAAASAIAMTGLRAAEAQAAPFQLRYILASSLYGELE